MVTGIMDRIYDFYEYLALVNSTSDFLQKYLEKRGKHVRSAVGTSVLLWNFPLELKEKN